MELNVKTVFGCNEIVILRWTNPIDEADHWYVVKITEVQPIIVNDKVTNVAYHFIPLIAGGLTETHFYESAKNMEKYSNESCIGRDIEVIRIHQFALIYGVTNGKPFNKLIK